MDISVVDSIVGCVVLLLGVTVTLPSMVSEHIFGIQSMMSSVSVWTILSTLGTILIPFVILITTLLGRLLWKHEKQIRKLKRGRTRQSRTLYGDEDDPQQQGLAYDINKLSDQVEELNGRIRDMHELLDTQTEKQIVDRRERSRILDTDKDNDKDN